MTIRRLTLMLLCILPFGTTANAQMDVLRDIVPVTNRVIIDNDLNGDPDGLFQLVHHMICPSVDVRGIIGAHEFPFIKQANVLAAKNAEEILALLGQTGRCPVIPGADHGLPDVDTPVDSEAAQLIIREALREDTTQPLYIVCGAGLTNIASALLLRPEIADKIAAVIWIGGSAYPELLEDGESGPQPGDRETNMSMCVNAAKVVFNHSNVPVWQVPNPAYAQCMVGVSELMTQVKPYGAIGKYLCDSITGLLAKQKERGYPMTEVYVLGDSPLVLLTGLTGSYSKKSESCLYIERPAPLILDGGHYADNPTGKTIRVYKHIDTRLMFGDLFAKLQLMAME